MGIISPLPPFPLTFKKMKKKKKKKKKYFHP
jgi:hypothetical protein